MSPLNKVTLFFYIFAILLLANLYIGVREHVRPKPLEMRSVGGPQQAFVGRENSQMRFHNVST